MTQILLMRHAQSANNAQDETLRIPDPGLTELGLRQAQAAADWLGRVKVNYLYCSPFRRSLETMRPIADASSAPVRIVHSIFEQGGCYSGHVSGQRKGEPGLTRTELLAQYPGWSVDETITDAGWWGQDYESLEKARARASAVARWILGQLVPLSGCHCLVIHADFKRLLIDALRQELLQPPIMETVGDLFNVGITRFDIFQRDGKTVYLNSVTHVPAEWIS
ncbi:MAG: histidine phosphatase family protein [Planctomycetales bacterium]|nr:histidine phosphatase family protein [Planctomycetales bacterium]